MSRQYQGPPKKGCCCKGECSKSKTQYAYERNFSPEDDYDYAQYKEDRKNFCLRNNQQYSNGFDLDDQGWDTLCTLKQKISQVPPQMQDDVPIETPCHSCTCLTEKQNEYGNSSILKKANHLIDYVPESEFLKRMKQQCQYLQNRQPNIFSTLDQFESSPFDCQKCSFSSDLRPQTRPSTNRPKSSSERCSTCNQKIKRNGADKSNKSHQSPVSNKQYKDATENRLKERLNEGKYAVESPVYNNQNIPAINREKKSEHIPRSKKPAKCRRRRKRKSGSSERCESEDQFEPTLKKPHENSCERCWRYASPSRSPVNKPDQRYNPNFRRGHSCTDFEKGDGDPEISPCKNLQTNPSRENLQTLSSLSYLKQRSQSMSPPPPSSPIPKSPFVYPAPTSSYSPIRVKGIVNDNSTQHSCERTVLRSAFEDFEPDRSYVEEPHEFTRTNPECKNKSNSFDPEMPSFEVLRFANTLSDLNGTEYKDIAMPPKADNLDSFDSTIYNSIRKPNRSLMTTSRRSSRSYSRAYSSRSREPTILSPVPEVDTPKRTTPVETIKNAARSKTPPPSSAGRSPEQTTSKHVTPCFSKSPTHAKCVKQCSPKKPGSGSSTKGKKNSQLPRGHKSKEIISKSVRKSPPKKLPKSPNVIPDKSKSSSELRENPSPETKKRPQTSIPCSEDFNVGLDYESIVEPFVSPHAIKDCTCFPRIPLDRNAPNSRNKHVFCCHCDWEEDLKNQTKRSSQNQCDANHFSDPPKVIACDCKRKPSPRDFPEADYEELERTVECPYKAFQNFKAQIQSNKSVLGERKHQAANEFENDAQPRIYCRKVNDKEAQAASQRYKINTSQEAGPSGIAPRKYFVYYMTQCKGEKMGDDVEVLVEELRQASPNEKDSRTRDITEKMRKIMECPSDSMALKFQKGVSESSKIPHSSRILYF